MLNLLKSNLEAISAADTEAEAIRAELKVVHAWLAAAEHEDDDGEEEEESSNRETSMASVKDAVNQLWTLTLQQVQAAKTSTATSKSLPVDKAEAELTWANCCLAVQNAKVDMDEKVYEMRVFDLEREKRVTGKSHSEGVSRAQAALTRIKATQEKVGSDLVKAATENVEAAEAFLEGLEASEEIKA